MLFGCLAQHHASHQIAHVRIRPEVPKPGQERARILAKNRFSEFEELCIQFGIRQRSVRVSLSGGREAVQSLAILQVDRDARGSRLRERGLAVGVHTVLDLLGECADTGLRQGGVREHFHPDSPCTNAAAMQYGKLNLASNAVFGVAFP